MINYWTFMLKHLYITQNKKKKTLNVYSQAFITAYHVTVVMLKITEKKKLR